MLTKVGLTYAKFNESKIAEIEQTNQAYLVDATRSVQHTFAGTVLNIIEQTIAAMDGFTRFVWKLEQLLVESGSVVVLVVVPDLRRVAARRRVKEEMVRRHRSAFCLPLPNSRFQCALPVPIVPIS